MKKIFSFISLLFFYFINVFGEIPKNVIINNSKSIEYETIDNEKLKLIISIDGVKYSEELFYAYYKDGKKYAHTIDPRTGKPVHHNLLSATVIAPTCMEADAWATAFMVLGPHVSDSLAATLDQIECMFICVDEQGKYEITKTEGFDKYIKD